ncbi:hypothetical protein CBL_04428 [Carabus blaptoides fortunei]
MTINKKDSTSTKSKKKSSSTTTATGSSSTHNTSKLTKKVSATSSIKNVSDISRSSSGVEIQDISDNASVSGAVVTYKPGNVVTTSGAAGGGVETITTYYTTDGGETVTQTVSYPPIESSTSSTSYVQYITEGAGTTSSSKMESSSTMNQSSTSTTSSNVLNTGFVEGSNVYTVTEPKEIAYNKKEGDSAWNGKFVYEKQHPNASGIKLQDNQVIVKDGNTVVESSASSSSQKKSYSMAKSSSSSYVIEIVDGKERIVDSKHHQSGFENASAAEEHMSTRSGTHVPTEVHHVQKGSDSKSVYDSANPALVEPKSTSSNYANEYHNVDGQVTTSNYAVSDNTARNVSSITGVDTSRIDAKTGKVIQNVRIDSKTGKVIQDSSNVDSKTIQDVRIDSKTGKVIQNVRIDSKTGKVIEDSSNVDSKTIQDVRIDSKTGKVIQNVRIDSKTGKVIEETTNITDRAHSDTNWDGKFTYEATDSKDVRTKHTKSDSTNFYGTSSTDSTTKQTYPTDLKHPGRHPDQTTSQQFITNEQATNEMNKRSQTSSDTSNFYGQTNIENTPKEKPRTDTNWDGTFVLEKRDNKATRKSQTKTDSRNFFDNTSTVDYTTETTTRYDKNGKPIRGDVTKHTQVTDSKDFYGGSTSNLDNVVVKNVYDTKATQNVIGGKTTETRTRIIYDSNGKVIEDTTDIVYSNDRNYGKSGWNGKFTYEIPQKPKPGDEQTPRGRDTPTTTTTTVGRPGTTSDTVRDDKVTREYYTTDSTQSSSTALEMDLAVHVDQGMDLADRKDLEMDPKDQEMDLEVNMDLEMDPRGLEMDRKDQGMDLEDRKDLEMDRKDLEMDRMGLEMDRKDQRMDRKDLEMDRKDLEMDRNDLEMDPKDQ